MSWNPETYREKREKVLGVRKRGLSFGSVSLIVSCIVVAGLGSFSLPKAVSYMKTRHLDDAIFRLQEGTTWPGSLLAELTGMEGVATASTDTHATRLVITYDRRVLRPEGFSSLFKEKDLKAALLNTVGHRQHLATLAEEREGAL